MAETNSQHKYLGSAPPQVRETDTLQTSGDNVMNYSQAYSVQSTNPKELTPDQTDRDLTIDLNGQDIRTEGTSGNEAQQPAESVRGHTNEETRDDIEVGAGMQTHTSQNTSVDSILIPVQEKEQLPDTIATVSGENRYDITSLLDKLNGATDTSNATSNPMLHHAELGSGARRQQENVNTDHVVGARITEISVGGTCASQIPDQPLSNTSKEISEGEKSHRGQQAEGDGDTQRCQTVAPSIQSSGCIALTHHKDSNISSKMADDENYPDINYGNKEVEEEAYPPVKGNVFILGEKSDFHSGATSKQCNTSTHDNTAPRVKPSVTANSAEDAFIITAQNDDNQIIQVNNDEIIGKAEMKVNSDVNQEINDKKESVSNEDKFKTKKDATHVSGVDGSKHMASQGGESIKTELLENVPSKQSTVLENVDVKAEESAQSGETAVTNIMKEDSESPKSQQYNSSTNIESPVRPEQPPTAVDKGSADSVNNHVPYSQVEPEGESSVVPENQNSRDIIDSDESTWSDSANKSDKEVLNPTEHNEIPECGHTGLSANDTHSGIQQSSASTIDMQISKSDTCCAEVVPNVDTDSNISSLDIESSCDTTQQQDVTEKLTPIFNDKKANCEVNQDQCNRVSEGGSEELQYVQNLTTELKRTAIPSEKNDNDEKNMDSSLHVSDKFGVSINCLKF